MGAVSVKGLAEGLTIWQKGANADFQLEMNKPPAARAESLFQQMAPSFSSNYITENFPGLLGIGELQEHKGEVQYGGLDNFDNSIQSVEYSTGLSIKHRALRADEKNLKLLQNIPALLSTKARKVKFRNLINLLQNNGAWGVDGLSVFNDNHFFGDNNITVTVSSTTQPTQDDVDKVLDAIWEQRATYVDDHGNALDEISDIAGLILMANASYMTRFRKAQRRTMVPADTPNGTGGAAVDNINADTFNFWGSPRFTAAATSPVIYAIIVAPNDDAGNPLGKSVPFLRTEFTPYELAVAGASPDDPVWRNKKQLESNVYGEEGLGVIDATRVMKITLST